MEALTDSLLDDLDDLSDVEPEEQQEQEAASIASSSRLDAAIMMSKNNDGQYSEAACSATTTTTKASAKANDILQNKQLISLLDDIRGKQSAGGSNKGNTSSNTTTYELIVSCNRQLAALTTEIINAHTNLTLAYKPKFPELEDLVLDPIAYKECIKVLQNEMDITIKNTELNAIANLNANQVLTITVAGSTTSGRLLTVDELKDMNASIEYVDSVIEVQRELTEFVKDHMARVSPNICAIVGAGIAARLVGLAGGLAELSRMPACNIQVMGQMRHNSAIRAAGAATKGPHMGIIVECDLVASAPSYLQKKVLKTVAAKVSLAARCDFVHAEKMQGRSSSISNGIDLDVASAAGRKFREEITTKITKWEEPDKARTLKALPKPDLSTKKRRGGKRVRRMKERFETTELQKQANKRSFNAESGEYGDDAMGLTLGMLDSKEGGNLRQTVDKKKMRQANTKASRKRAVKMTGSGAASSGLVSSMIFTPVQGLELVNPDAAKERVREANKKWFLEDAGFQSALPKKGS